MLRRCRDFEADLETGGIITPAAGAKRAWHEWALDELGTNLKWTVNILRTIIEKYDGGPVGLNTLSAAVSEEQDTLEEVYEPFLDAGISSKNTVAGWSPGKPMSILG